MFDLLGFKVKFILADTVKKTTYDRSSASQYI